jgi:hypothetical protein
LAISVAEKVTIGAHRAIETRQALHERFENRRT